MNFDLSKGVAFACIKRFNQEELIIFTSKDELADFSEDETNDILTTGTVTRISVFGQESSILFGALELMSIFKYKKNTFVKVTQGRGILLEKNMLTTDIRPFCAGDSVSYCGKFIFQGR